MTDTEFQKVILEKLTSLEGRFDGLEGRFDGLKQQSDGLIAKVDAISMKLDKVSDELTEFKGNQEEFNNAIWNMNTQSFQAINEVRNEVLPPWKARKSVG